MKVCTLHWLTGILVLFFLSACSNEDYLSQQEADVDKTKELDNTTLRELKSHKKQRLTIEKAFVQLPVSQLLLEGLRSISAIERKQLLKERKIDGYTCTVVGNYLEVVELPDNLNDETEELERLTIAVYNALTDNTVVFISQELVGEKRHKKRIVQQQFLAYDKGLWHNIRQELPLVTTTTFLEESTTNLKSSKNYIYFDLQETDIHYLQAHLQHTFYPIEDSITLKEAYEVAYVWTGDRFRLNRKNILSYPSNKAHSK
ncbi:MAG: hypothetical protein AB8E82_14065 [Aureispira sp.]